MNTTEQTTMAQTFWREPSGGQQYSEVVKIDDEMDQSFLSFTIEGENFSEVRLTAHEIYVSGDYKTSWAWDFGIFSQRSYARQYAVYVVAGWLETRSFGHCPSVQHIDE
jgi:hypothetical protein